MRKRARTDTNHATIRDGLRQCGYSVADTSRLGDGFPDLVVGIRGRTYLLEIKPPRKANKLTPAEQAFMANWQGHYAIVTTLGEALEEIE